MPRRHHIPITQPPREINTPRLGVKYHLVATTHDRPVLFERGAVANDTPPIGANIVRPEIVKGLVPVPAPKEVDVAVVGIDAHGMSTALGGHIAVGVDPI